VDENPSICINKSNRLSECCEKCGGVFKYSRMDKTAKEKEMEEKEAKE